MAEDQNTNTNTNPAAQGTDGEGDSTPKTYTEEEVQELLQRETDRKVTQALKTAEKNWEKKLSLAKLDGEARETAEREARIAELEQQLHDFQLEKNRSELKSVLSSRGLSAEFADIISITDDITESQAKIEKLDKLFKAAVKTEVERRLSQGSTPKTSSTDYAKMTREEFSKLSLSEMQRLKQTEPEIYKALIS